MDSQNFLTPQQMSLIFMTFFCLKHLLQFYLSLRNSHYIAKNRASVPKSFSERLTLDEHQKAADYTMAKSRVGRVELFVDALLLLAMTLGGGINWIDEWVRSFEMGSLQTGLGVFVSVFAVQFLVGLPFNLYSTFVVEEKFGHNRTTGKLFILDLLKGGAVFLLIGLPFLGLILYLMESLGKNWWVYAWLTLTVFQLFILWLYPVVIAPLFNKFTPLGDGELKDKVTALMARCGFSSKGLFVMDASRRSSHSNAYFTGFGKNKRIVFFDTLIKQLTPDEIVAVLAHELGHFKFKHVTKRMIVSFAFSFLGLWLLGVLSNSSWFYFGHGVQTQAPYMALLVFSLVSSQYTFFLTPIMGHLSRKNEFEADDFAKKNAKASDLVTSLVKLTKENSSTLTPDPLYSLFYYSHPPVIQRIEQLES